MPYIKENDRVKFAIMDLNIPSINTAGELNYAFTLLIKAYMENMGVKYSTINDIVGALEGAKLEFYRRVASQYENIKIKENGDVY